jgi:hypothetical protein
MKQARWVLVVTVLAIGVAAACSSGDPFSSLPDPKPVVTEPTTSTSEIDFTKTPLNGVPGSTTTVVAIGPGPLTIVGRVVGPDGAVVPDAIVQLERVVGVSSAETRVPTAPDGTWNAAKVLGGRYRIRAWRVPDLATLRPQIVFLESGPERAVNIKLEALGGVRVDSAIAPDPPLVGEAANLKVRVAERSVTPDGVIHDAPVAGASVGLTGSGEWEVSSPNPSTTGGDGSTIFRVQCLAEGSQPLAATLETGQSFALSIPACYDPSATTTTTSTTTTSTTRP